MRKKIYMRRYSGIRKSRGKGKNNNIVIMEQYIVSARKYRPQTFESVIGQAALTATLKNPHARTP